ncbi:restriction endonuclease subunit S [Psychrobacter sp. 219-2-C]|uniref:restriction endonuclease subunit S n=1 Tax=Psychrobacter sp. 219-2-C TaxID=3414707 RepID=UPI003C6E716F
MVPNGWVKSKISDIANIAVGRDLKEESYSENKNDNFPFPVYSNTVSARGLYGFYNFAEYSNEAVTVVGRGIGIGTAFSRKEPFGAIGRLLVLEPKNNAFDVVYFENYINSYLRVHHENGAIPQLPGASIAKYDVVLPPLLEQQKIAKILSTWDKAISTTERLIENSTQQKKALMQQLLTGKKRLLDDEGKRFDKKWERIELGKLLDYKQPTPYLVKSTDYSDEYPTPVLTAGKTFILGYTDEEFGIFSEDLPTIIFDDFTTASKFVDFPFKAKSSAMKMLVAKDGVSIKYIFEVMQALSYAIGGHQRHWISIFANIVIGLPCLEEQQKITAVSNNADKEIELLEQQLADLQQEKKALMQVLLTGKKRVVVDGEVA